MNNFWTGFEKHAKTRFMKEFLKNPAKMEKLLGKGVKDIASKGVHNTYHARYSGLGTEAERRLFDAHKDSIRIRDLSYQHPIKRMATVRMPDGTFKQLDMEIPKNFHNLPKGPVTAKSYQGIHTPEVITQVSSKGADARGYPILHVKDKVPNTQQNVTEHVKNWADSLKHGGGPAHRVIGSKKKILLTHMTEGGVGRVLGKEPHYLSQSGHYDLNRPNALFAHVGEVKGTSGGTRHEFAPNTKIVSSVPERDIVYRPPNTMTDKENPVEAVVPRHVFASHLKKVEKI